jgi:hypothetical protein
LPAPERIEPWFTTAKRSGFTLTEEQLRPFKEAWAENQRQREIEQTFTGLQKVRKKAQELTQTVRSEAFDDWIRRCVVIAEEPAEWTQARHLYANYLDHAKHFGRNSTQRATSVQAMATETQWGRMMATLDVAKTRRGSGVHYSLRLKARRAGA